MVDEIKNTLFVDRLRTWATVLILFLILIVIFCSWMYPRSPKVEQRTLDMVAQGLTQLKEATVSYQQRGEEQLKLNQQIADQLEELKKSRVNHFEELQAKYGIADIPDSDDVVIPLRVRPQSKSH